MSGHYAVIPGFIMDDTDLSHSQMILYAEISALCNRQGYCWAGNTYFEKKMGVSDRSIRNWLSALKKKKYIYIEVELGFKRKIYLDKRCNSTDTATFKDAMKADLNSQVDDGTIELPEGGGSTLPGGRKQDSGGPELDFRHNITVNNTENKEKETPVGVETTAIAKRTDDDISSIARYILVSMTDVFPITSSEFPVHNKKSNIIAKRIFEMAPESPREATDVVLTAFRDMIDNTDGFWAQQPFTAFTLASPGIWSRVINHIRKKQEKYENTGPSDWDLMVGDIWN